MKVYLLNTAAGYKTDPNFEVTCKMYQYKSDVYSSLDKALKEGLISLNEQIKDLYKGFLDNDVFDCIDEFVSECLLYFFYIYEIDLERRESGIPSSEETLLENPYKIEWSFDFKGELLDRVYFIDESLGYSIRPSDIDRSKANMFEVGDIVVAVRNNFQYPLSQLYIILRTPKLEDKPFFINEYYVCFLNEEGYFDSYDHTHYHGDDLKLYQGEIPEGMLFLSKVLKGEIYVDHETKNDILDGKYIFSEKINYKSILKK